VEVRGVMKREAWGVRDLTRNGIKKKRKKVRKSKKVDYYFLARSSFFWRDAPHCSMHE
jgi:hypothetical protein